MDVLEEERRYADWKEKLWMLCVIGWHAVLLVFRYHKARKTFFRKMRTCFRCPIFDRTMYRCGEYTGSENGCRCFMPLKIKAGGKCWLRENFPDDPGGWV